MIDKILFWLKLPFFIPHYLLFKCYMNSTYIRKDLERWSKIIVRTFAENSETRKFFYYIIKFPEFRTVFYYRIGGVSKLLRWYAPPMPTCYITTKKDSIGPGLVIEHGHSSRIGPRQAGKNLSVWQNVTIGKSKPGAKDSNPVIGDNVSIMTGSVVFGNITIGNNVTIGAMSVVFKSVPDNCVVVGNPARIVRRNGEKVNIKL